MSMTEFAMVEELASLVKDNLHCKHLILSVEEALVDFLQSDTSSSGILELEPMNSYNRLLSHRLADIFGFSHESVGEGDDRHLILERCPETSIPSILVGDILWQYDETETDSPTTSHLLLKRTEEALPVKSRKSPLLQQSLEEREAAYLAARERIFSRDLGQVKESVRQKPRSVPVVARRMIAHALGQRINPSSQDSCHEDCKASGGQTDELNVQGKVEGEPNLTAEAFQHTLPLSSGNSCGEVKKNNCSVSASPLRLSETKTSQKQGDQISGCVNNIRDQNGRNEQSVDEHLKREHLGAAKRMFAHALGMRSGKMKHVNTDMHPPEHLGSSVKRMVYGGVYRDSRVVMTCREMHGKRRQPFDAMLMALASIDGE